MKKIKLALTVCNQAKILENFVLLLLFCCLMVKSNMPSIPYPSSVQNAVGQKSTQLLCNKIMV